MLLFVIVGVVFCCCLVLLLVVLGAVGVVGHASVVDWWLPMLLVLFLQLLLSFDVC